MHDWLTGMRGGERVLHELAGLFPEADLYTLVHVPGSSSERIEGLRIRESPLARLPGSARHYRKLLPLFPWAIERFHLRGYDLVLSSSHAVAKGVRVEAGTPHLCYCFTPMRYVWDQAHAYLGGGARRALAWPLSAYLRHFDVRTAGPERVTRFTAISQTVADRIRRCYGRAARVVYPPVDLEWLACNGKAPEDFFLLVSSFAAYKRDELAIEAFRGLRQRLVVVGDGPRRARLAGRAPPNVEFTGHVGDEELAGLYARCRALVFPAEEDFGLVAVEAQAAGRPVIAYGAGGATESVIPHTGPDSAGDATGIWFEPQTSAALAAAVRRFEAVERDFEPAFLRAHAGRFGVPRFRAELGAEIARARGGFAASRD